jgi:2-polyprenyl-3-methyl-5-hydroxy-6-metoxy-1,4-benzoquinol methylase
MRAMDKDQSLKILQLVNKHLESHPRDKNYVDLLLQNKEFSPNDKAYYSWLKYNLSGIENGNNLIDLLEEKIGPIQKFNVLDIGAGGGGNSIAFAKYGCDVTAIEIDDIRVDWIRTRVRDHGVNINIIKKPIETVTFKNKFDLIICNAVLEHVGDWKTFLRKLIDVSKGYIYLCWPNKYSLLEIISDSHYKLFGAVFFTGRLQRLQKYYIRVFGIKRNAWVTTIPSLSQIKKIIIGQKIKYSIEHVLPKELKKINIPNKMNHTLARRVIRILKLIGVSINLINKIIILEKNTYQILITIK